MNRKILIFVLLCLTSGMFNPILAKGRPVKSKIQTTYNVVWNTPSPDAWESMPLSGRYGACASGWVQEWVPFWKILLCFLKGKWYQVVRCA